MTRMSIRTMTDEQVAWGYSCWTNIIRYDASLSVEEYERARERQAEFSAELDRRELELH